MFNLKDMCVQGKCRGRVLGESRKYRKKGEVEGRGREASVQVYQHKFTKKKKNGGEIKGGLHIMCPTQTVEVKIKGRRKGKKKENSRDVLLCCGYTPQSGVRGGREN